MSLSVPEISFFNFETNETLNLERIIRATFANHDRKKFAECKNSWGNHPLYPGNIDPEALIQRIASEKPKALQKFN